MVLRIRVKDSNGKYKIITIPRYNDEVAWDSGGGGEDNSAPCDGAYVDDTYVIDDYIEKKCS